MIKPDYIGLFFVNGGSILNSVGAIINCLGEHNGAYILWMIGNPFLLVWAVGYIRHWWNGTVSVNALAAMYAIFIIGNVYAMWKFVLV